MGEPSDATTALASALASLVRRDLDVADILATLVADCAEVTSAGSVAILAMDRTSISLLAATSHRAAELEMLQAQRATGPCVEAMTSGARVTAYDERSLVERWGEVGQAVVDAGFCAVEAYPMRWHGVSLGGLNVFYSGATDHTGSLGQAFADMATLVIAHSVRPSTEQVRGRLHEALRAREVVEQAKGVIAFLEDVDLDEAYERLLERTRQDARTLTQVATSVVEDRRGQPPR